MRNYKLDYLVTKWSTEFHIGIKINCETISNSLLYADDQFIMQETEDNLERDIYKLSHHIEYTVTTDRRVEMCIRDSLRCCCLI